MVHVKKCPLGDRGRATTEFYIEGKPQKYCYGRTDMMNDEPFEECKRCLDYVNGEQMRKDIKEYCEQTDRMKR